MTTTLGGLIVVGEGEQLVVMDVRKKLLDNNPLSASDKPPPKTLLTTVLPFCPTKVVANPTCPSHVMAVGGMQCAVCVLSARAEASSLIRVEPGGEGVMDAFWVPHSESLVCVVTRACLQFFHLSPKSTVLVGTVTLADSVNVTSAAIAAPPKLPPSLTLEPASKPDLYVLVVSSNGALYHAAIDSAVLQHPVACAEGSPGMKTFTATKLPPLHTGLENAHSSSVYWSQRCQIMCISYEDGRLALAKLQDKVGSTATVLHQVCVVPRQDSLEGAVEVLGEMSGWGNFILAWPSSDGAPWGVLSIEQQAVKVSRVPCTSGRVAGAQAFRCFAC